MMLWLRLLTTFFVLACPPATAQRTVSLAERAEEHHDVETAVDVLDLLRHRLCTQLPPPSTPLPAGRARARHPRHRLPHRRAAPQRRRSRHRRSKRLVFYASDHDDDDDEA